MIPDAILSRIARLALVLLAAILFGVIYGLVSHDRIMLLLTSVLAITGGAMILLLFRSVRKREFCTIEATILSLRRNRLRQCQVLSLSDDSGNETEICIKGKTALAVGSKYRLYLSEEDPVAGQLPESAGFLKPARVLLGYEKL